MANTLLLVILVLAALAAILAGMSVFSGSRPPDGRIGQIMDEMEELKGLILQIQKSVIQLERKNEKEFRDLKGELKDVLERMAEKVDKRLAELAE
ncbi:MAG: hypothetical protein HY823_11425 [Acidobacteria bacterium]|nr:hypothetical protein [Acidobacteriota bacterium]